MEGVFVVGWARRASEGLVGIARRDAEIGATRVLNYLDTVEETRAASAKEIGFHLAHRGLQVVAKADLPYLARAEETQAAGRGLPSFKFRDDAEMFSAIEQEKSKAGSALAA
jgi:ferredoxin--NADP+ reductase